MVSIIFSAGAAEDKRSVLALFNFKSGAINETNVHVLLEMPLNRLGMVVDYHDINDTSYPDPAGYRGVVVWFADNVSDYGKEYYAFLHRVLDSGGRIVLMNGPGIEQTVSDEPYNEDISGLLKRLGIVEGGLGFSNNPFTIKVEKLQQAAFGFEIAEAAESPVYRDYRITGDSLEAWMGVTRSDVADSQAVVVAVGSTGGFISDAGMVLRYIDDPVWGVLWDLNPFVFLSKALAVETLLKPDVTTANGNRVAFIHVDGDGSSNMTQDVGATPQPSTKVLREKVLERYPFPASISAIAYLLTPEGAGNPVFVDEFKKIMALPQIQAASHTYSHPMIWSSHILGYKIPGYTFDPSMETVGSIEMIKELALPPGKEIDLLLWSGDCQPMEGALAALDSVGFQNLNGGNARVDALYQGICHISSLSIKVGAFRQCYAMAGNEYLYTNSWTENYGGFVQVLDTFKNTEKPRYIPVNVYYHLYVTERQAGLKALTTIYDWCAKQDFCWLHADEYTRSVQGFFSARTGKLTTDAYYIEDYSGLHTVRLDAESRSVDMLKSSNILGYTHFDGDLYIALAAGERAEIYLTSAESPAIYLKNSTALVRNTQVTAKSVKGEVRLYNPGFIAFAGGEGHVEFKLDGHKIEPLKNADGAFPLPQGTGEWQVFEAQQR